MQTVLQWRQKARNGVGICVRNHQDKVLEVCQSSDRMMAMEIMLSDNVWTIVSAYAPQVGCDEDKCILELAGIGDNESATERKTGSIAGEINGHVGEGRIGFERWHGGCSVGARNEGGEKTVHPAHAYDLAILNTFYSNRREHQILLTYKSGGNATVIDYIRVRREI